MIFYKKPLPKREGVAKRKSGDLPKFNIKNRIAFGGKAAYDMILKRALTLFSVSSCLTIYYSQEKDIDTVFVFDNQMKKVKLFHSLTTLSPADIQKTLQIFLRFYDFSRLFILKKMVVEQFLHLHFEEQRLNKQLLCGTELISILSFWDRVTSITLPFSDTITWK